MPTETSRRRSPDGPSSYRQTSSALVPQSPAPSAVPPDPITHTSPTPSMARARVYPTDEVNGTFFRTTPSGDSSRTLPAG
jgi:hypothetical protein